MINSGWGQSCRSDVQLTPRSANHRSTEALARRTGHHARREAQGEQKRWQHAVDNRATEVSGLSRGRIVAGSNVQMSSAESVGNSTAAAASALRVLARDTYNPMWTIISALQL